MPNVPILYDMHMHTPLCKHARGEPEEYAEVAQQRGLKGIIFTCHNPTDGWAGDNVGREWSRHVRMSTAELDDYVKMVERARAVWAGRVDVRVGLECDYIPGMELWIEELLGKVEFHHVLGSVHPQIADYKERFFDGDIIAFQQLYFEHLAMAAETGLFDTLSHPDLVKNIMPTEWNPDQIMDDICRSLDRIAAAGTAMELNTSGLNKTFPEMNPGTTILAEMYRRNIPVVVNSDSHDPYRVGAAFEDAFDMLGAVGYTHTNIVLDRKRRALPLDEARASLRTTDMV